MSVVPVLVLIATYAVWAGSRLLVHVPGAWRSRPRSALPGPAPGLANGARQLFAEVGGREVFVRRVPRGRWPLRRDVLVMEVGGLPVALEASADLGGVGWLTGDPRFDATVRVAGPRGAGLAVLGPDERARLRSLVAEGASVRAGRLCVPAPPGGRDVLRHQLAARMVALVDGMAAHAADVSRALVDRAVADPEAGVRLAALEALAESGPLRGPAQREVRRLALTRQGELRLRAAELARDLEAWVRLARDRQEPATSRVRALHAAARVRATLPPPVLGLVQELLDAPSAELRLAALEVSARRGGAPMLRPCWLQLQEAVWAPCPATAWLLDRDGEGLARLVGVIEAHGSEREVPDLLAALPQVGREAQRAILGALGRHGRLVDVEALLALADGALAALSSEVRDAVRRIQGRLTDADRGRLSLARGPGGELTAVDDAGGLRLVDAPADRG